jgi:hypothetical protein
VSGADDKRSSGRHGRERETEGDGARYGHANFNSITTEFFDSQRRKEATQANRPHKRNRTAKRTERDEDESVERGPSSNRRKIC